MKPVYTNVMIAIPLLVTLLLLLHAMVFAEPSHGPDGAERQMHEAAVDSTKPSAWKD